MSDTYVPDFERHWRQTLPSRLAETPERLFDACVFGSLAAYSLSYHYDNKLVTAVAPAWDDGLNSEFVDPKLKLLSAGSYKPVKEESETDEYLRVCAEQNLIDNALKIGDTLMGVLFIRASDNIRDIEGSIPKDGIRMCKPCRGRSLKYLGSNIVVVSLRGYSLVPVEAMTLEQQIEEQDFGFEHESLAKGAEAKDLVVELLTSNRGLKKIEKLPNIPSRKYRRQDS